MIQDISAFFTALPDPCQAVFLSDLKLQQRLSRPALCVQFSELTVLHVQLPICTSSKQHSAFLSMQFFLHTLIAAIFSPDSSRPSTFDQSAWIL